MLRKNKDGVILKFEFLSEQTVGNITKFLGLVKAKYLIYVIDSLDLEANPRASKTGNVTNDIQESIETDAETFPFKTKGILLASSKYERLERGRIRIVFGDPKVEGILDGGHNTLAIGLYILKKALSYNGQNLKSGNKTWSEFKALWKDYRDLIDSYLENLQHDPEKRDLDFLVPVELLGPSDVEEYGCVEAFKGGLLEICAARNNNVQLQVSAKANQKGYFDDLKKLVHKYNAELCSRIEWKTNDGGTIKVQDLIALAWIPLQLITPVKDSNGNTIESIAARDIYAGKGKCLKLFEKLMGSPEVTNITSADYIHELKNTEVLSALDIGAQLPELYDYIYENFPKRYNENGGSYGRITAVKSLNETHRNKKTPFLQKTIETLSPDGYIVPLVYGLKILMEKRVEDGVSRIYWKRDPKKFLDKNFATIVSNYKGLFSMCDYDPQKIGKNAQSYKMAEMAYTMAEMAEK